MEIELTEAQELPAQRLAQSVYDAMRAQEYNVRSCKVVRDLIIAHWDAATKPTALLERFTEENKVSTTAR